MRGNPDGTANVNALKQGSGKNNNRFKKTPRKREVSRDLCGRCGTKHAKKNCPALGQKCRRCENLNNYQSLYRTKLIATVGEEDSEEDESYKICTVDEDSRRSINKALVDIFVSTKKPGNQVRFQVDTGSECNLLPIKLYKSLTGDTNSVCYESAINRSFPKLANDGRYQERSIFESGTNAVHNS